MSIAGRTPDTKNNGLYPPLVTRQHSAPCRRIAQSKPQTRKPPKDSQSIGDRNSIESKRIKSKRSGSVPLRLSGCETADASSKWHLGAERAQQASNKPYARGRQSDIPGGEYTVDYKRSILFEELFTNGGDELEKMDSLLRRRRWSLDIESRDSVDGVIDHEPNSAKIQSGLLHRGRCQILSDEQFPVLTIKSEWSIPPPSKAAEFKTIIKNLFGFLRAK
ncbi:hypothetical protein BDR26DRAFT_391030 [Obelidium mucronatum]|nr:hypothetical protein BDR26DRAFT_391030 [Obelidium mucronatum]